MREKKMAKYLRNAWYAAAWSEEIGGTPLGRTFLEQPVVLFRETDGTTVALADRCPHRFAPLSKGKLVGNAIECPYHGLRFGADGQCVHNYHGPVTKAASVHRYPVMECYGLAWIWMGDAGQIGRASGRERVGQEVEISGDAVSLKKKNNTIKK